MISRVGVKLVLRGVWIVMITSLLMACSTWHPYKATLEHTPLSTLAVTADQRSLALVNPSQERLASLGVKVVYEAEGDQAKLAVLELEGYHSDIKLFGDVNTDATAKLYHLRVASEAKLTLGENTKVYHMVGEGSITISANDTIVANPQVDQMKQQLQVTMVDQLMSQLLVDYGQFQGADEKP